MSITEQDIPQPPAKITLDQFVERVEKSIKKFKTHIEKEHIEHPDWSFLAPTPEEEWWEVFEMFSMREVDEQD